MIDINRYRKLAKGNKLLFDRLVVPPYNFTVNEFKRFKEESKEEDYVQEFGENFVRIMKGLCDIIEPTLNVDINKTLRLVEIEEDLIELVKNTDNKIFHRPLFFPTVFINNDIYYDDDAIIKGMVISEAITSQEKKELIYGESYKDHWKRANNYAIAFNIIDEKYGFITTDLITLIKEEKVGNLSDQDIREENIENFIRNMVVNIVDMVEGMDRDLNVTIIETTKEQNLKRTKRGQIPIPTKVYIRAQGEFKKYVSRFKKDIKENEENIERRKILHKFIVRGHWRHFRSERYVYKMGKMIWIKPFFKGEGILIAKEYKLVQSATTT